MPYKSLSLGAFWTIFGRNFPTGVLQLLYPYQPADPAVESIFKALKFLKFSRYIWATERKIGMKIKFLMHKSAVCQLDRSTFPELNENMRNGLAESKKC